MHLVFCVCGGPLCFVYGTKGNPNIIKDIKEIFKKADSIEFICVDPNTNAPYELDPHEGGLINPDFKGKGWSAKLYKKKREGIIASFHYFCGSYSTNLNNGIWIKEINKKYILTAIKNIKKTFPKQKVTINFYKKAKREVNKRLQRLTKI